MASHSSARGARAAEERAVLAASAHLTERDRYLVRMVGEHRVLTTDQLAALGFGNVITARHRLSLLVRLGVLRRFRPRREVGSAPWHFLLWQFTTDDARIKLRHLYPTLRQE
jgi:Replication-relaxation